MGLPPGTAAKVSESLELLGAYHRLPKSLRPTAALEKVGNMLASKDRALNELLQKLFNGEWLLFAWDEDMQLTHRDEFGNKEKIEAGNQETAIALIMHRWVSGLLESDFIDPSDVVSRFFQATSENPTLSDGHPAEHWLHSKVRDKWLGAKDDFLSHIRSPDPDNFSASKQQTSLNQTTVIGKTRQGSLGMPGFEIRVQLGLEREGWRIQSIEKFKNGNREVLFE